MSCAKGGHSVVVWSHTTPCSLYQPAQLVYLPLLPLQGGLPGQREPRVSPKLLLYEYFPPF